MALPTEKAAEFADMWISVSPMAQQMLCDVGEAFYNDSECDIDEISFGDKELSLQRQVGRIEKMISIATDNTLDRNSMIVGRVLEEIRARCANSIFLEIHRGQVGRRVAEERQRKPMTQEELADATGLHQSYISRIESGKFAMTYTTVAKLAVALNVPIHKLDPKFEKIGQRIRAIREQKRKELGWLAKKIGITTSRLKSIEESGDDSLSPALVKRIADTLGVRERQVDPTYNIQPRKGPTNDTLGTLR